MANCPVCGGRVPLGGGRTVKNAQSMLAMAEALTTRLKPGVEGAEARAFVDRGRHLADNLHNYGHKYSMVNPDWAAAGLWMNQATMHARNIGAL